MRKDDKLAISKEKILVAADRLLREADHHAEVTSRAIAAEADVPLGMINYCFGSREKLLYEVFVRNKDEYLTDDRIRSILTSDAGPKDKIRKMYYLVADFLIDEYKFTRAVMGYVLLNRDLTQGLTTYPLVKEHFGGQKEEWELKFISYQLSSMMQLVIYRLDDMQDFLDLDPDPKEEIHRIIDLQTDLLLGGVR